MIKLTPTLSCLWWMLAAVSAQGQNVTQTGSVSFSPTPVSTSIPSPTVPLNATVLGQGMYPPAQAWCNKGQPDYFCPGMLLQDVELAGIFADSKTFVDKPTNGTLNATLQAYQALPANKTVGDIEKFVEQNFKGEGLELSQVQIEGFNPSPALLNNISDPILKGWVSIVNSYWSLLIRSQSNTPAKVSGVPEWITNVKMSRRETNNSAVCTGPEDCESSLIPLNHTIVVPGGRYREIYYWDSRWIIEGLLKSELYTYAEDLLENFMDLIDVYGFLPNGGRKYYLNRSQPPMFIQMLDLYIKATNNVTILERALPMATKEMAWWRDNRFLNITSPFTNKTYMAAHYAVNNSAPRPEGYVEDYTTVMGSSPTLNESAQADLYAELATGAETGWDYSARWCKQPVINVSDNNPALRTLNTRAIIPVDLTALLVGDHSLLADYYELFYNNSGNGSMPQNVTDLVAYYRAISQNLIGVIQDVHWDPEKAWFYDFNMTSNNRSNIYSPAGTWPLWQNVTPPGLEGNETMALQLISGKRYLLGKYSGIPSVATLAATGLNWDFPNSWPPHLHTSIKAFETLGRIFPNASVLDNLTVAFSDVAPGQLGFDEAGLQPQPGSTVGNTTLTVQEAQGKPWPLALSIEFANRYMQAAFCSWYSTGGEIEGLLTQLPLSDLNATGTYTAGQSGVMFEKFNATDTDAAGGGGEYTVQVGFGWTNGVVISIADEYGQYLPSPTCPMIPIIEIQNGTNTSVYANGTTESGASGNSSNTVRLFAGYRIPRED